MIEVKDTFLINEFFLRKEHELTKNYLKQAIKKLDLSSFNKLLSDHNLKVLNPALGGHVAQFFWNNKPQKELKLFFFLIMWISIVILISMIEGNFVNKNIEMDLLHSFGTWNTNLIALPGAYLISNRYFRRLPFVLFDMALEGSIRISIEDWNKFTLKVQKIYNLKIFKIIPYLTTIYTTLSQIIVGPLGVYKITNWQNNSAYPWGSFAGWLNLPFSIILSYLITLFVIRIILTSYILKTLFSNNIHIKIFHPDGCGGLNKLGKLSQSMNVGIFLFGISLAFQIYHRINLYNVELYNIGNLLYVMLYVLLSAALFFLPLYFVPLKMKDIKYKTLEKISENFERVENSGIQKSSQGLDDNLINRVNSAKNLYDIAKHFPVFPFNYQNIYSFFMTILIPIILFIVQIFISKILFD